MSKSEELEGTTLKCSHCRERLWFDGTGCFCINKKCIVYNQYVVVQDKGNTSGSE